LVYKFNAALDLPAYSGSGGKGVSAAGSRVAKKKKKPAAASGTSPRGTSAAGASTAAKTHKNKKTTK